MIYSTFADSFTFANKTVAVFDKTVSNSPEKLFIMQKRAAGSVRLPALQHACVRKTICVGRVFFTQYSWTAKRQAPRVLCHEDFTHRLYTQDTHKTHTRHTQEREAE